MAEKDEVYPYASLKLWVYWWIHRDVFQLFTGSQVNNFRDLLPALSSKETLAKGGQLLKYRNNLKYWDR